MNLKLEDPGSEGDRELGLIDDSQSFVEDNNLWQCDMVRAGTMAGFPADVWFREGILFKIYSHTL